MAADSEKDSTLHQTLLTYFETSLTHPAWASFHANAISDFEFYEGKQWTDDELSELKKRTQPPIVENHIKRIVDKIEGQYVKQQTRLGFKGRNFPQDEDTGNILTDLALYVQQQADYEYEEKDSFKDGLKAGMGVIESGIDLDGYYPKINLLHDDCLCVFPDPYSKKYDWSDAEFVHKAKWATLEDVKAHYPDKVDVLTGAVGVELITNTIPTFKKENYFDETTKRVRLIETWHKVREERKFIETAQGPQDVTDIKSPKKLKEQFGSSRTTSRTLTRMKIAVWCVGGILVDVYAKPPYEEMFKFIPYFVDRKKNGEPVGIIRALKDPQSEINSRRSKALHLLNNRRITIEENAVRDKNNLREEMARSDGIIEYKKGYKVELAENVDVASTQMQLHQESVNAIDRIAGLDLGFRQEVRSNQQLQRKQAAEDVVIIPIFDNLRRTRKIVGKHIYELVKEYFNEEMVFNITDNQQGTKQVIATQEQFQRIKEGTFDIITEEMPETTTIQEQQFQTVSETLQSFAGAMPPPIAIKLTEVMIRSSQLRDKQEILKVFEGMNQPPPEEVKISLSMNWSQLTPQEKAAMATKMGMQELAQFEMQNGLPPEVIIKEKGETERAEIKAEAGQEDPEAEMAMKGMEMDMKDREHRMKMAQSDEQHRMKMAQKGQEASMKMQTTTMSNAMNLQNASEMGKIKKEQMRNAKGNSNRPQRNK